MKSGEASILLLHDFGNFSCGVMTKVSFKIQKSKDQARKDTAADETATGAENVMTCSPETTAVSPGLSVARTVMTAVSVTTTGVGVGVGVEVCTTSGGYEEEENDESEVDDDSPGWLR